MNKTIASIVGTLLCLAALAAWFKIAPAQGSGWILTIAFLGSLALICSIKHSGIATVVGLIITAAAGYAWFFQRFDEHANAVLALCVIMALATFTHLGSAFKDDKSTAKTRTGKSTKRK